MGNGEGTEVLPEQLVERVLDRLGFSAAPTPDLAGLREVYAAWCYSVPFDNLRKRIHLHAGEAGPLPGDEPADLLGGWLDHGAGGTCWAGNGALWSVLVALGFPAVRGIGTMLAVPIPDLPPNHGTVGVDLDGARWLVDASMISVEPLRLADDDETEVAHPARGLSARQREGRHHVSWNPGFREPFDCRIESFGASADEFARRHEQTRAWSPFNFGVMVRQNRGDEVIGMGMGQCLRILPDGSQHNAEFENDNDRLAWMVDELGYDEALAARVPPDEPMPSPSGAPS